MKKIISLLLALLVVLSLAVPAFAAGSTITAKYEKKGIFSYEVISEYHETDLFDGFKNVMPGDKRTETITVVNKVRNHDYIKVSFRADPHDSDNPPEYDRETAAEEGKSGADMENFLKQLRMVIYNKNDQVVYDGPALDAPDKKISLGTIRKNKSVEFDVELYVPIEMDNTYANRVGEVDWVFTVEAFNDSSDSPKTGDYVIIGAVALLALSGAALVILLVLKKKRKK